MLAGVALIFPLLIIHGSMKGKPIFLYICLLPLIFYIIDRTIRMRNVRISSIISWKTHEEEGEKITDLIVECPPDFDYKPGQYCELKFKPLSSYEWHSFTIIWCPKYEIIVNEDESVTRQLKFFIKATGKWTNDLYNFASAFDLSKAPGQTKIYIRGELYNPFIVTCCTEPFELFLTLLRSSSFSPFFHIPFLLGPHGAPATNFARYKHIMLIGSGVGVTPLISIWRFLAVKGHSMISNEQNMISLNTMQMIRRDTTSNMKIRRFSNNSLTKIRSTSANQLNLMIENNYTTMKGLYNSPRI